MIRLILVDGVFAVVVVLLVRECVLIIPEVGTVLLRVIKWPTGLDIVDDHACLIRQLVRVARWDRAR